MNIRNTPLLSSYSLIFRASLNLHAPLSMSWAVIKKLHNANSWMVAWLVVADIKRVNNFIREQDLYALKSIKIPVKTHGLLTESSKELRPLPAARSQSGVTWTDGAEHDAAAAGSADSTQLLDYFRGIDRSIRDAVQAELSAEYRVEVQQRPPAEAGKRESSSGADCGIQWWNAVFIMLLVGIVLPVFYIVYFKTQENGPAAHTSNTTATSNISADALGGKLLQSSVVDKNAKGEKQPNTASPPGTRGPVPVTRVQSGG
ncbi:lysM and putative peptidoglycan-binding domain-containing protein 4 isoform X2 [Cyrtonyx montezumae]|uniref:lysM and putative peptidoglycan-binding domain-containing protein 4 isoform X2 n=1 Tax=Cyrtonyx montezumae TaxID=9017 RepID=UPI0032DA8D9A